MALSRAPSIAHVGTGVLAYAILLQGWRPLLPPLSAATTLTAEDRRELGR